MRTPVHKPQVFDRLGTTFATAVRILLNILLVVTIAAIAVGVVKSGYDLVTSLQKPLEALLQKILLDVVFILALVEVTLIIIGYLKEGRVHVRFIVDTILIIMLNEILNLWFEHPDFKELAGVCLVIATLVASRIALTRLMPRDDV